MIQKFKIPKMKKNKTPACLLPKPIYCQKSTKKSAMDNVGKNFAALSMKRAALQRVEYYSINGTFLHQFYSV
jgi:hypothetical protein